jgi:hypothetical protein
MARVVQIPVFQRPRRMAVGNLVRLDHGTLVCGPFNRQQPSVSSPNGISRAFLMTEFANAVYGRVMQVLIPGIAFGLAHAGYLNQGFLPWLGIMLPAFLGIMWGIAYLLGLRSLLPVMVAHFLNDSTALPWIAFFMVTGSLGRT